MSGRHRSRRPRARPAWVLCALLGAWGCVAAPGATRDGGTACTAEADCNGGATCGLVRLCVGGVCSDDRVFRACDDGRYGDASTNVGQCLTYIDCNRLLCGALIPCVAQRCDTAAPSLVIPCGDASVDAR